MFTFTPNCEFYANQTHDNYDSLIRKVRSIYCGKVLRIEGGIVTALPHGRLGQPKIVGTITKH